MATFEGDVWHPDGETLAHYPIRDGSAPVTLFSIYQDNTDNVWLGTHKHGVFRFNGEAFARFRP